MSSNLTGPDELSPDIQLWCNRGMSGDNHNRNGHSVPHLHLAQKLAQRPNHWLYALNQITNANPVQPQHRGNIKAMATDWIAWGS